MTFEEIRVVGDSPHAPAPFWCNDDTGNRTGDSVSRTSSRSSITSSSCFTFAEMPGRISAGQASVGGTLGGSIVYPVSAPAERTRRRRKQVRIRGSGGRGSWRVCGVGRAKVEGVVRAGSSLFSKRNRDDKTEATSAVVDTTGWEGQTTRKVERSEASDGAEDSASDEGVYDQTNMKGVTDCLDDISPVS